MATGPYGKIIPMAPVSLIVVGAGQRGTGYARWARRHPERSTVVAVAEPSPARRARLAAEHGITPQNAVTDWTELAGRGRLANAVLICTQDRMHAEPAEAFAALGYHILLEKPMAPDEAGCRRIVAAVEKAGVMLAVGHVMRYTPYTRAVKQIADSGQLGDIMSVQHLEPVGFWHQAHSYVRGNWRRSDLATSMLMAKSCHDLDWLQYILGRAPLRVSSFGSLTHFTAANRPPGAADRCVACSVEPDCPYSAPRLYRGLLDRGARGWPLSVVIGDFSAGALDEALTNGPYGRCVYACDNDAVDHQVVALEFPGATTATFTMTAFTQAAPPADPGVRHPRRAHRRRRDHPRLRLPHPCRADGHPGGRGRDERRGRTRRRRRGPDGRVHRRRRHRGPRADLLRAARVAGQPPRRLRRRTSAAERHGRKH